MTTDGKGVPTGKSPPLRIAFLTPEFTTEKKFDGGLANYLNRVGRALVVRGHRVEVFVISDREESFDHGGMLVHRVASTWAWPWRVGHCLAEKLTRRGWSMTADAYRGARALARAFKQRHRQQPFDVVQSSDFMATGLCLPKTLGLPHVVRLSLFSPWWRQASGSQATRDRLRREWMELRAIRKADFRYAPSNWISSAVHRALGLAIDVLHPPAFLELDEAQEDSAVYDEHLTGKEYVLFFGRVCRLKGVYALAQAIGPLLQENPRLWLVMVGREDPSGIVAELREILAAGKERLIHLPRLGHDALYPIIRRAALVALPSLADNFPNTCIEAMGLGKVVVATRETGFDDLIQDGCNGFLAPANDPDSLRTAIQRVLKLDPNRVREMGDAARQSLHAFHPDRAVNNLVEYYDRCIRDYRAGQRSIQKREHATGLRREGQP